MCLGSRLISNLITVRIDFPIRYIVDAAAFQVWYLLIFTVTVFPSSCHYLLILLGIRYFSWLYNALLDQKGLVGSFLIWLIEKRLCLSLHLTVLSSYCTDLLLFSLRMLSCCVPLNLKGFVHAMSKVLNILKISI